jgi:hypothetical protein
LFSFWSSPIASSMFFSILSIIFKKYIYEERMVIFKKLLKQSSNEKIRIPRIKVEMVF